MKVAPRTLPRVWQIVFKPQKHPMVLATLCSAIFALPLFAPPFFAPPLFCSATFCSGFFSLISTFLLRRSAPPTGICFPLFASTIPLSHPLTVAARPPAPCHRRVCLSNPSPNPTAPGPNTPSPVNPGLSRHSFARHPAPHSQPTTSTYRRSPRFYAPPWPGYTFSSVKEIGKVQEM